MPLPPMTVNPVVNAMAGAVILDGKAITERMKADLLSEMKQLGGVPPRLAIISFDTPTSQLYLTAQLRQARALGITADVEFRFPWNVGQEEVERAVIGLNQGEMHGIFVHQPMPPQVDPQRISALIDPRKDVEGIHPQNMARRFFAKARIGSCTALAVMRLIEETGETVEGKEAVVVGHSEIVGRPVSMLLLDRLATTTVCHVATQNLQAHVSRADVLVVAVGRPQLIRGGWIKPGAIVIDVGINVVGGKVVGDVEFESAKARAGYLTPVPGGVGPVTVMMVMKNTVEAFKLQQRERA